MEKQHGGNAAEIPRACHGIVPPSKIARNVLMTGEDIRRSNGWRVTGSGWKEAGGVILTKGNR